MAPGKHWCSVTSLSCPSLSRAGAVPASWGHWVFVPRIYRGPAFLQSKTGVGGGGWFLPRSFLRHTLSTLTLCLSLDTLGPRPLRCTSRSRWEAVPGQVQELGRHVRGAINPTEPGLVSCTPLRLDPALGALSGEGGPVRGASPAPSPCRPIAQSYYCREETLALLTSVGRNPAQPPASSLLCGHLHLNHQGSLPCPLPPPAAACTRPPDPSPSLDPPASGSLGCSLEARGTAPPANAVTHPVRLGQGVTCDEGASLQA